MTVPKLRILVVAENGKDAAFVARVVDDHGDEARITDDVTDALGLLARSSFDVVFVSLALPRGDGLALVHHIRALHTSVDVIAMSSPHELAESAHAIALGVLQTVMLPPNGDAILLAVDRARERRILVSERARLAADEASSRRRNATYARCAAFVAETDLSDVAKLVLEACLGELASKGGAIYVPSLHGAGLERIATIGEDRAFAPSLDDRVLTELDPTSIVQEEDGRVRVALIGDVDVVGLVELHPEVLPVDVISREGLEVVAGLGTAALVASRKVDAIARAGIKDPDTSAYTFAYFGEVAGREIDRAARFGRRFALLTISLVGMEERRRALPALELVSVRRLVADAILEAVRDSDIVARVEDDEYYALLPETALLGALATRRRIKARVAMLPPMHGRLPLEPIIGIATFPADGVDLGRLLRVSKHRSEQSRRGVHRRLDLGAQGFWDAIDRLVGPEVQVERGPDGQLVLSSELLRVQDDLTRHAILSDDLVVRIATRVAEDAVRFRAPGSLYVAGDDTIAGVVAAAIDAAEQGPLRAWVLGTESGPGERIRLAVTDPRIGRESILLTLGDLGGYVLVARPRGDGTSLVFHSSDLDLVEGLVTAFQQTYHLQPEVFD